MKKWTVGMIAVALLVSMVSVWAEDGAVADKKGQKPGRGQHQKGRRGVDRGERMMAADKNADGKITLEEFTDAHLARMKEMFEKMDVNKDGVISEEDRVAARAAREAKGEKVKKGKKAVADDGDSDEGRNED